MFFVFAYLKLFGRWVGVAVGGAGGDCDHQAGRRIASWLGVTPPLVVPVISHPLTHCFHRSVSNTGPGIVNTELCPFSCAATLHVIMFFCISLSLPVHLRTQESKYELQEGRKETPTALVPDIIFQPLLARFPVVTKLAGRIASQEQPCFRCQALFN